MMNVVDDYLVIEEKGIYSVEILNVQTLDVLAGYFTQNEFSGRVNFDENLKTRQRINRRNSTSVNLYCFSCKTKLHRYFDAETLDLFAQLDDFDIIGALKSWQRMILFVIIK
jgi:hypothetical protein